MHARITLTGRGGGGCVAGGDRGCLLLVDGGGGGGSLIQCISLTRRVWPACTTRHARPAASGESDTRRCTLAPLLLLLLLLLLSLLFSVGLGGGGD